MKCLNGLLSWQTKLKNIFVYLLKIPRNNYFTAQLQSFKYEQYLLSLVIHRNIKKFSLKLFLGDSPHDLKKL